MIFIAKNNVHRSKSKLILALSPVTQSKTTSHSLKYHRKSEHSRNIHIQQNSAKSKMCDIWIIPSYINVNCVFVCVSVCAFAWAQNFLLMSIVSKRRQSHPKNDSKLHGMLHRYCWSWWYLLTMFGSILACDKALYNWNAIEFSARPFISC